MSRPIGFTLISILIIPTIIAALFGCGDTQYRRAASELAPKLHNHAEVPASEATGQPVKARFVNLQAAPNVARRIIYDADVSLVVKDMTETEAQIGKLLKKADGYIAEATIDRRQGEHLTGQWRVRVPVAQFDTFLDAVSNLGVAENRKQTAQDVTEEYVDLEAQITNKKRLEERIVALLKDSAGKIKDVIEVEHELARVRGEIEQMEGRLRYLTNRTDFTTVSISARVDENYVPPAAPSFLSRIAQAWTLSLDSLRIFGEQLAVAVVYAMPWFAILCVVVVPAFLYARRRNVGTNNRTVVESQQNAPQG
jgi:uncharacterized coiled-coil protein SlyX